MLSGIFQDDEVQLDLFQQTSNQQDIDEEQKQSALMAVMDELNSKFSQDRHQQAALFIASEGIKEIQTWQMNRQLLSPCYTIRIIDVLVVK